MHDGNPYGYLRVGNKVIQEVNLAVMVGVETSLCKTLFKELEEAEVFSRDENGVVYCRRLVRDEDKRNKRVAAGKLGGNPALLKGEVNQKVNQTVADSSMQYADEYADDLNPKDGAEKRSSRFAPPTVQEVSDYVSEKDLRSTVDPEHFIDFYTSKNWMVGKNKMKDWKAAVRNWSRKSLENPRRSTQTSYRNSDIWDSFGPEYQAEIDAHNAAVARKCGIGGEE